MKIYLVTVRALIFGYLTFSLIFGSALAAELSEPQKIIEDASTRIQGRMQDQVFSQNFPKVTEFVDSVINPYTDFDLISSLVLGKFWKDATPAEQESFKKEFKALLIRSYSRAFVEFKNWTVNFLPLNSEQDDRKVLVKTQVIQPGIQPVSVDYRMFFIKGEWKVYDILIDGISLVTTYRASFKNDIERTGSLQVVIDHLIERNAESVSAQNRQ
ncbi:MlaC/ttg2D family ABC transporter substrate-binding protein [Methylomonas sp. 2BW1-5-20]|uniref:MlaC/ttg2D family ABC transporter substrate-binding protein n=1 Tax=Methylomonas sp. 2BW1-5-20 TaxID=3376686 RepID=UPI00404CF08B